MNTATIMDLAWEGAQVAFRLIMAARSRKDAEAIVHQLRALGPADRADVGAVEAEALLRLRQDEPTQSTRVPLAPDFPVSIGGSCPTCGRQAGYGIGMCDGAGDCTRVGGPLGEGD